MEKEKGKYEVNLISKYFITRQLIGTKQNITNLKLQKLLYFSQALNYHINQRKLFNEDFKYHKAGVIVESEFNKYFEYNFNEIFFRNTEYEKFQDYDKTNRETIEQFKKEIKVIDTIDLEFLDKVWQVYKNLSGKQMEKLVFLDSPIKEFRANGIDYGKVIDVKDIKMHILK